MYISYFSSTFKLLIINIILFQEISQQLGDDKTLSEHLKLPIQRINDYQLLLKVRYALHLYVLSHVYKCINSNQVVTVRSIIMSYVYVLSWIYSFLQCVLYKIFQGLCLKHCIFFLYFFKQCNQSKLCTLNKEKKVNGS